ncbi:MAG: cobalamin-binding protein [Candidatus Manganitrophaceae bacterium]
MNRIVSLIASGTEIVSALGLEEQLVGRSHECDYPPSVGRLPVCTGPNFSIEGSSAEIDRRVKETLHQALSIYRVDTDLLKKLRPTHLITQTQCEVCAVSLKEVEIAMQEWILRGGTEKNEPTPTLIPLAPNALSDIWADILRTADALGVSDRGRAVVDRMKTRMSEIEAKINMLSVLPTVAGIEWIDPLMAGGNWMPELIAMAGGTNLFGEAGKHSPWMTWESLVQADPDFLLIFPCGFDISRTEKELPLLTERSEWPTLRAVRKGKVFLLDGNQYFNRPGPRLAESLEILAEILHPELFRFGHEGSGWIRLSSN